MDLDNFYKSSVNIILYPERVGAILPRAVTDSNRERRSEELNWQYSAKVIQDVK